MAVQEILKRYKKIKYKKLLPSLIGILILIFSSIYLINLSPYTNNSSANSVEYVRAKVLSVSSNDSIIGQQTIRVRLLDGKNKGTTTTIARSYIVGDANSKHLPIGSEILLTIQPSNGNQYTYLDRYRIPGAITILLVLLILVVVVGRWRGVSGVAGLIISIGILSVFVLPRIIAGDSAFATCVEGAFMISTVSIYIAHGFNKRTTIAYASTVIILVAVILIAVLTVHLTGVIGNPGAAVNANEQTSLIQYAPHHINLLGLFLGGMIIASLGILEDITTGQAAAVDEIHKANSKLSFRKLYLKGLSVGHEHIAALINTLGIVYVGVALPTIVLTELYASGGPLSVTLNNETIMEAVVRIIVPSIGLLLAVPLSTALAAYILPKWYQYKTKV
ncbi:MAG TPA: YibE/F family protein [Candidatus Saccharimonadales bacterium]